MIEHKGQGIDFLSITLDLGAFRSIEVVRFVRRTFSKYMLIFRTRNDFTWREAGGRFVNLCYYQFTQAFCPKFFYQLQGQLLQTC